MFKKAKNQTIEDYPNFDLLRYKYVIATGCGDGWIAYPPISNAIKKDIQAALDNAYMSDKEHAELSRVDWRDWVDYLYVEGRGIVIAEFNLHTWEWETS